MAISLRSPRQASQVYAAGPPRQRNLFLVRFHANGRPDFDKLTYVVKHCDRPKISPKAEELNQYNKRRQVYTGFKLEAIKVTFYDSADGMAQKMWQQYSQYYFGDFAPNAAAGYNYDITTPTFNADANFGLSEGYGGADDDSAQWFFSGIDIFHFYVNAGQHYYDAFTLKNPRITSYEPDDLDYENAAVNQITMQFVYENLQVQQGQPVAAGQFGEFGQQFAANTGITVPDQTPVSLGGVAAPLQPPSFPDVRSLITPPLPLGTSLNAGYRTMSPFSFGGLATLGNFSFGAINTPLGGTAQYGYNTAPAQRLSADSYLSSFLSNIPVLF
jgi:hypothetical protein